ncbi:pre-mRNA-processing protein 40A-like isoform X3 [Rhododendron vialii]|uniref:pre-mRNA-processing protein 40A-like isoform X3 n=1 Tax=Rhododendron vialii TaxID=182163 RepID=UPI00265EB1DE|nr:pre-mRNA-processing protein 40A-like isoform X3 [Rhododendron vialii]
MFVVFFRDFSCAAMANNAQFSGMQPLRPPIPPGPPQGAPPPMPMQFRTAVPAPQSQVYIPMASQQFQHVGHTNIGMPFHSQQFQFSSVQQLPAIPAPEVQANRPPQNPQIAGTYGAGLNGPRMLLSSTYTFGASPGGQLQRNADASVQYQLTPQTNASSFSGGAQPWLPTGPQSMISVVQNTGDQSSATPPVVPAATEEPNHIEKLPSDWLEHIRAGKRYYYNKKTKFSTWEKPLELMTSIERADASTDWKEHTSPEGRKYYYNRVTKQSKWKIPDELKLAREKVKMASTGGTLAGNDDSPAPVLNAVTPSSLAHGSVSSPIQVATVSAGVSPKPMATSGQSFSPVAPSMVEENAIQVQTPAQTIPPNAAVSESTKTSHIMLDATVTQISSVDTKAAQDVVDTVDRVSTGDIEEAENGKGSARNVNVSVSGEKTVVQEPVVYENKLEARNAFKALLESANIGSDWTWDQAMRVIINDQRYGALRTLGERKQAFNEFLVQRKKKDAEERRARQKKAQEDFRNMLEESKDLMPSSRWSKVITIFEDDERFKAVERAKDREDLFQDYMVELEKKERANALEELKWSRREFLNFLKSCDFITASSQWRKVQDRLEADERCSRLEKVDRLEIFQEYIRDLEREEEEHMKIRMEELRKVERKNRDEFRRLMEEHVVSGILTTSTHWRDYCMKVKDLAAYLAVSSNTSGSTAKDLFEDVAEELQKQYLEDKARIKDAMKSRKIALSSTSTLEDFKAVLLEGISSQPSSEINLKLVFDELHERVKEKEEKEAKKRKRLADDFYNLLCTSKDLTASSKWEDCKQIIEDRQESWFVGEDSFFRNIFDEYITEMKEKEKEKERKRRDDKAKREKDAKDREKKEKHSREKRRRYASKYGKDRTHSEDAGKYEPYVLEESKRSGKDKNRRHRERYLSHVDDLSVDENEKDRSENSHRHSSDRKKSKQMEQRSPSEQDSEIRHKRHKQDHQDGSSRNDDYGELRDREFDCFPKLLSDFSDQKLLPLH